MSSRQQQWQKILDMTRRMKQLSEEDNWPSVLEVQTERQNLLESFFSSSISAEDAEQIAQGIRDIMHSDKQLLEQGSQIHKTLGESLLKINASRKAAGAYDQFTP